MTDVDWDALQVGDPDPTPDDGPWCLAESPVFEYSDISSTWACTRRPHEAGRHVAGNGIIDNQGCRRFGSSVVAVWPSDG